MSCREVIKRLELLLAEKEVERARLALTVSEQELELAYTEPDREVLARADIEEKTKDYGAAVDARDKKLTELDGVEELDPMKRLREAIAVELNSAREFHRSKFGSELEITSPIDLIGGLDRALRILDSIT